MGDNEATFKNLVASLAGKTSTEKVQILKDATAALKPIRTNTSVHNFVKDSNIFQELANVLHENEEPWVKAFPDWIRNMAVHLYYYPIGPKEQYEMLLKALRFYIIRDCEPAIGSLANISAKNHVRNYLLTDNEVYAAVKRNICYVCAQQALGNLATGNEEWQVKLLQDASFINVLVEQNENISFWDLIFTLAQHPEAKTLLPHSVFVKASTSKVPRAFDTSTLLCNDEDISKINLDDKWLSVKSDLIHSLLTTGKAVDATDWRNNWLDLLLPISNLSGIETLKDKIGKKVTALLLQVVFGANLSGKPYVVMRGKQEASKALWNLAYLESNRALIAKDDGVAKLKTALKDSKDPVLVKYLEGILFMFEAPPSTPAKSHVEMNAKKYVMISYNWGNQPLVLKLSQALKEHGYGVWLDVEQMQGSTLEAMAGAVENAELVLICMSQKYKDSPNCRLEGEYCINRRIKYIPLMMQQGYRPDGWLGIILGSKLWYDFSDDNEWSTKMSQLVKAIGDNGKRGGQVVSSPVLSSTQTPPTFATWNLSEVSEWLNRIQLGQCCDSFVKHNITGRALAVFKTLRTNKELSFLEFKRICEEMGITKLGDILCFYDALTKL